MEQIQCDARGSARVFKAAFMLFTNPNMTVDDAMKAAEFTKREISKRSVRKSISKKKHRLLQAAARRNNHSTLPPVQNITVSGSSGANLSSISNSSEAMMLDDNPPNDKESEKSSINRKRKKKGRSYKTSIFLLYLLLFEYHLCSNSLFHVITGSSFRAVKSSHPVCVTKTVCSNCALLIPSTVTAVQLSFHVTSCGFPKLIMVSTVNT